MKKRIARDIHVLKWLVILIAIFVSAILAAPLYAIGCWVDRDASELWAGTIGARLLERWTADCDL